MLSRALSIYFLAPSPRILSVEVRGVYHPFSVLLSPSTFNFLNKVFVFLSFKDKVNFVLKLAGGYTSLLIFILCET